jgi:hypothetical protein
MSRLVRIWLCNRTILRTFRRSIPWLRCCWTIRWTIRWTIPRLICIRLRRRLIRLRLSRAILVRIRLRQRTILRTIPWLTPWLIRLCRGLIRLRLSRTIPWLVRIRLRQRTILRTIPWLIPWLIRLRRGLIRLRLSRTIPRLILRTFPRSIARLISIRLRHRPVLILRLVRVGRHRLIRLRLTRTVRLCSVRLRSRILSTRSIARVPLLPTLLLIRLLPRLLTRLTRTIGRLPRTRRLLYWHGGLRRRRSHLYCLCLRGLRWLNLTHLRYRQRLAAVLLDRFLPFFKRWRRWRWRCLGNDLTLLHSLGRPPYVCRLRCCGSSQHSLFSRDDSRLHHLHRRR